MFWLQRWGRTLQEVLQFSTRSKHPIFGWFCWVTQTLRHIHAERQDKLAKTKQQVHLARCTAVRCRVGSMGPNVGQSRWLGTALGRTCQLPAPGWHSLSWTWAGTSKAEGRSGRANSAQLECTSFIATGNHLYFYAEWRKCSPPMLLLMLSFLL